MQMDIMTCEHLHTIGDQSKWHKGEPTALAKLIWRLIQAPLIMCNKEHKPTNAKNEKSEQGRPGTNRGPVPKYKAGPNRKIINTI